MHTYFNLDSNISLSRCENLTSSVKLNLCVFLGAVYGGRPWSVSYWWETSFFFPCKM